MCGSDEPIQDFSILACEAIVSCARIYGGRNSRVFRLQTASGRVLAGKHYHQHKEDTRDRLGTEWRALNLLMEHGVVCVATPVAQDQSRGLALYSFLDGPQASLTPATEADMAACLEFLGVLLKMSGRLSKDKAEAVPAASEACFSLAALATNIRRRLSILQAVSKDACLGAELATFLSDELEPFLVVCLERAHSVLDAAARELPQSSRILSPSDFGLHNAIRSREGLRFVDFEYFGWDDPAKTLCDFVLHPAMSLPEPLQELFARGFLGLFGDTSFENNNDLQKRVIVLYPLFGIKWCLILLNEFVRSADARRQFATQVSCEGEAHKRRFAQLFKARAMLNQVKDPHALERLY